MKSLFIMTVRNENINRQTKYTVEHGNCMYRRFMLYPYQDILVDEKHLTQKEFIRAIQEELSLNIGALSHANIYFNGENYRKFMNMGKCLW